MNKRRFNDQYAHIVQASKTRAVKTKFRLQEVSLTLTPDNELSAEVTDHDKCRGEEKVGGAGVPSKFGEKNGAKQKAAEDLLQLE